MEKFRDKVYIITDSGFRSYFVRILPAGVEAMAPVDVPAVAERMGQLIMNHFAKANAKSGYSYSKEELLETMRGVMNARERSFFGNAVEELTHKGFAIYIERQKLVVLMPKGVESFSQK